MERDDTDDCPFVLEFEVDEEISFKPSAFQRSSYPLPRDENLPPPPANVLKADSTTKLLLAEDSSGVDCSFGSIVSHSVELSVECDESTPSVDDNHEPISTSIASPIENEGKNTKDCDRSTFFTENLIEDTNATVPEIVKEVKSSRLPLQLHSSYDEHLHLPKYSQAEFDAALEAKFSEKLAELEAQISLTNEQRSNKDNFALKEIEEMSLQKSILESKVSELSRAAVERKEELDMQRTQTRALGHRLQVIETELENAKKSAEVVRATLVEQHARELAAAERAQRAAMAEHTRRAVAAEAHTHEAIIAAHKQQLLELEQRVRHHQQREHDHEKALHEAVAAAKAGVYAKVKVQFDNGNKEFQRIKISLKEAQAERDAKNNEVATLTSANADLTLQLKTRETELQSASAKLGESHQLIKSVAQILVPQRTLESVIPVPVPVPVPGVGSGATTDATSMSSELVSKMTTLTIDAISQLQQSQREAQAAKDSLQAAVGALETSLRRTEASLTATQAQASALEERVTLAEALLAAVRIELAEVQRERDEQMNVVAKMTLAASGEATGFEERVRAAKHEAAEANERCANLRRMNEELLAMLESSMPSGATDA